MIFVRNLRLRPNTIAEPGENFYWRRRIDGRLRLRSVDEEGNRVSRSPQEVASPGAPVIGLLGANTAPEHLDASYGKTDGTQWASTLLLV